MSNMSYCMFENTRSDLQECYDTVCESIDAGKDPIKNLSKSEQAAAWNLLELCKEITRFYDNYDEEDYN